MITDPKAFGGNALASHRSLGAIAREISRSWTKPYFGAVPYLHAMHSLDAITDNYGADSAKSIVLYFLSNATTWRGEDARRIKAELKALLETKSGSVECPHCHWGFAPSVIAQHIREKH